MRGLARAAFVASLAAGILLAACGGSVGSGGTGAPLASAQGTVTSFGSVVVDGVVYEDDGVGGREESAPGRFRDRPVALGQQVELAYEMQGGRAVLRSLTLSPSLVGPVVRSGSDRLVMGQKIETIDDPQQGPLTVLEGTASLDALAPGDWVEVHAVPWRSSSGYRWRATRVEKLAAATEARVSGTVTEVGPGQKVRLGTLVIDVERAVVAPPGHVLRSGDRVTAWGSPDAGGLRASALKVEVPPVPVGEAPGTRLAGVVGRLDVAAGRFDLGGVPVDYRAARVTPAGEALAEGRYVQIEGQRRADGMFAAEQVKLRRQDGAEGRKERVQLKGRIEDYRSPASFKVRGTRVDASMAQLRDCAGGLRDGVDVRVQGWRQMGTPVQADWVECRD